MKERNLTGTLMVTVAFCSTLRWGSVKDPAHGFTVVVMPVFAENETIGNVIRTDPVAGTMLETLKKVTIYYASSIDTSVVSVPNVVGMLKAKAEDKIRAQGLMVGDVSYEPSSASLKGYVIAQTPVADSGYKVAAGSAVNLVIGSGVSDKSSVNFSITLPSTNAISHNHFSSAFDCKQAWLSFTR